VRSFARRRISFVDQQGKERKESWLLADSKRTRSDAAHRGEREEEQPVHAGSLAIQRPGSKRKRFVRK
jgi:hypothetical protein